MKNTKAKGKIIVFEGIDGSGKSTQIKRVAKHIRKKYGRDVVISSWKNSAIVGDYLKKLNQLEEQPSALALSIIVAADLSERIAKEILPAVEAGKIVLCDRYTYTGIIREEVVNNFDHDWLIDIYSFAPKPDLVLYFKVTDAISVQRVDSRMEEGLEKLAKKLRKKQGKVSKKKVAELVQKLKGSMSEGSITGSMVETIKAIKKGEKLYQINGDPLTEQIANEQRLELVNKLIAAYDMWQKKEKFIEIDAMKTIKEVSRDIKQVLKKMLVN